MIITREIAEMVVEGLRDRLGYSPCMFDPQEDEFWTDDTEQTPWKYEAYYYPYSTWDMYLVLELEPHSRVLGEDELFVRWGFGGRAQGHKDTTQFSVEALAAFVDSLSPPFAEVFPITSNWLDRPDGLSYPKYDFHWSDIALTLTPTARPPEVGPLRISKVEMPGLAILSVELDDMRLSADTDRQLDEIATRFCSFWEPFRHQLAAHFGGAVSSLQDAIGDEFRRGVWPPGVCYAVPGIPVPDEHDTSIAARKFYIQGCHDARTRNSGRDDLETVAMWEHRYGEDAVAAYQSGYGAGHQYPCLCCRQWTLSEQSFVDGLAQCPRCQQWSALIVDTAWTEIAETNCHVDTSSEDALEAALMQLNLAMLPNPAPLPSLLSRFADVYGMSIDELRQGMAFDYAWVPGNGDASFHAMVGVWLKSQTFSTREAADLLGVSTGWVSTQAKQGGLPHAFRGDPTKPEYETGRWRIPIQDVRAQIFEKYPRLAPPAHRREAEVGDKAERSAQ